MTETAFAHFTNGEPDIKRFEALAEVFRNNSDGIVEIKNTKGLGGDDVLGLVSSDLERMGFKIERSKKAEDQIVFSASSEVGESNFHVDGYHPGWDYILEVEGGRRDSIYKDFLKGLLLKEASTLVLAVPSSYDYGRETPQSDKQFKRAKREAAAIHDSSRFDSPCDIVVIGY